MIYPLNFELADGTKVEVNISFDGKQYIFDLIKPNGEEDSFTYAATEEDEPTPIDQHRHEALHQFWAYIR
jgi:hypothetical protein